MISFSAFVIGRTSRNSALTARDSALTGQRAAWTEEQKVDYQKRQTYLAGERRFIYVVFGVLVLLAVIGGGH